MYFHKLKLFLGYVLLLVLLTACGHPIPTASIDLIKQKKSVLVLTNPSLNKSLQSQFIQMLNTWKQTELITYEWVQQVSVVDDLLIDKINQTPYSYIIVIGIDLIPTTLTAAAKTQDRRWIVLSDATDLEAFSPVIPDNMALYQVDGGFVIAQWDQWAKQQQLHAVNQVYNSVSQLTYGFSISPHIPTVDYQKRGSVQLIWGAIWAEQLKVVQLNSFEKGTHYYNAMQMRINY